MFEDLLDIEEIKKKVKETVDVINKVIKEKGITDDQIKQMMQNAGIDINAKQRELEERKEIEKEIRELIQQDKNTGTQIYLFFQEINEEVTRITKNLILANEMLLTLSNSEKLYHTTKSIRKVMYAFLDATTEYSNITKPNTHNILSDEKEEDEEQK